MLNEEQKQDVFMDIKIRVGEWVGETTTLGSPPQEFTLLYEVFTKADQDLIELLNLEPIEVLNKTLEACKKLGFDEIHTSLAIDNWSAFASQYLGLSQDGYPECLKY
jgi:hypothetical protein